jgi:hypothetical protein
MSLPSSVALELRANEIAAVDAPEISRSMSDTECR